MHDVVAQHG